MGRAEGINLGHLGFATVLPPEGTAEQWRSRAFSLMQHNEGSVEKEPQEEGGNWRTSSAQNVELQQTAEANAGLEPGLEPELDSELDVHKEVEVPEI